MVAYETQTQEGRITFISFKINFTRLTFSISTGKSLVYNLTLKSLLLQSVIQADNRIMV